MQSELIQFNVLTSSRAKRSSPGLSQSAHTTQRSGRTMKAAMAIDQAFADFARVDPAETASASVRRMSQSPPPVMAESLIASIATQLEALDGQCRHLEQLLSSVDSAKTV